MKKLAVLTEVSAIPASGRGKKSVLQSCVLIAAICAMPVLAHAQVLTTKTFTLPSAGGNGSTTSDMIYNGTGPDGISWSGGAEGVQGSLATHNGQPESGTNPYVTAANVALKFDVGATVDSLNATYGAGNWTIADATLTFQSSGATQGNARFGLGGGTFDIFWVANDAWIQTESTTDDTNPPYASSTAALTSWSASLALLDSATYSIQGQKGPFTVSDSLTSGSGFVNDILSSSAAGNANVSLYLMDTSNTLGMLIYMGGNQEALPTLSFDVNSVTPTPAPPAMLLLGSGLFGLEFMRRKKKLTFPPDTGSA